MTNLNQLIVHHRSSHHARYSGYARLIDFLDEPQIIQGKNILPYRLAKGISQLSDQQAGLYDSRSVQKEVELYQLLRKTKTPGIVHYLNGERDIRYVLNYKKVSRYTKYCASFHKPPEILKATVKNNRYLKQLDAAICVGANQVDFIKNWLGIDQVKYIPHGVDTTFFKPLIYKRSAKKMLFVGQHLRDFEMLNKTIPEILAKDTSASLDVVLKKEFQAKVQLTSDRVRIHTGIDDDKLKQFYQEASFLYLPLVDATACNSILEGLASGLAIVTSAVGGNMAYLKGSENFLIPADDKTQFVHTALNLLAKPDVCLKVGQSSRELSFRYDWNNVAKEVEAFYQEILV